MPVRAAQSTPGLAGSIWGVYPGPGRLKYPPARRMFPIGNHIWAGTHHGTPFRLPRQLPRPDATMPGGARRRQSAGEERVRCWFSLWPGRAARYADRDSGPAGTPTPTAITRLPAGPDTGPDTRPHGR